MISNRNSINVFLGHNLSLKYPIFRDNYSPYLTTISNPFCRLRQNFCIHSSLHETKLRDEIMEEIMWQLPSGHRGQLAIKLYGSMLACNKTSSKGTEILLFSIFPRLSYLDTELKDRLVSWVSSAKQLGMARYCQQTINLADLWTWKFVFKVYGRYCHDVLIRIKKSKYELMAFLWE